MVLCEEEREVLSYSSQYALLIHVDNLVYNTVLNGEITNNSRLFDHSSVVSNLSVDIGIWFARVALAASGATSVASAARCTKVGGCSGSQ